MNNLNIEFIYKDEQIPKVYNRLKGEKVVSLDIETTKKYNKYPNEGLDPYTSKIIMFQIGTKDIQFVIDYRKVNIGDLRKILIDPKVTIVGHNIKFEYKHILHNEGIRINNLYDTMVAEMVLNNGYKLPNGLKDLNERYLNITVDKSTRLEFLTIKNKDFTDIQITYGAQDVLYPLLIREKQLKRAKKLELLNTFSLEFLFTETLGEIEYIGLGLDEDKWKALYFKKLKEFKEYEKILDNFVLDNYKETEFINKQLSLFESGLKCAIQWTSSKQVVAFFKYLGICPQEVSKTTKKLSYTVEAKVLKSSLNTLNKDIGKDLTDLIKTYLKYKELEQSVTTFGINFLKHINPITNRLHTNYRQILSTGRISSSPNLQNIPGDKEYRQCFTSRPGWKIVNADYSSQETVILANYSREPNIINLIDNGGCMHCFVTKAIWPELEGLSDNEIKKLHADKRQVAKAAGFAVNYGGTGYTIANNLGIPESEGNAVYEAYFRAFPELKKFFKRTIRESMSRGYIVIDSITGRKFFFANFENLNAYERGKYERACLNYIIQGTAGSITKLAAILVRKWILENNLQDKVLITNLIHDEINLEVKEEYAELAAENLVRCMIEAGKIWCKEVPLKATCKITNHWTH